MLKQICLAIIFINIFSYAISAEQINLISILKNIDNLPETILLKNDLLILNGEISRLKNIYTIKKVIDVEPYYTKGKNINLYSRYDDPYFSRNQVLRYGINSKGYLEKTFLNNSSLAVGAEVQKAYYNTNSLNANNMQWNNFLIYKREFLKKDRNKFTLQKLELKKKKIIVEQQFISNRLAFFITKKYIDLLKSNMEINLFKGKINLLNKVIILFKKQIKSGDIGWIYLQETEQEKERAETELKLLKLTLQNDIMTFCSEYTLKDFGLIPDNLLLDEIFIIPVLDLVNFREILPDTIEVKTFKYEYLINKIEEQEINEANKPALTLESGYALKSQDSYEKLGKIWNGEFDIKLNFNYTYDLLYKNYRKSYIKQKKNYYKSRINKLNKSKKTYIKQSLINLKTLKQKEKLINISIKKILSTLKTEKIKLEYGIGDIKKYYKQYEYMFKEAANLYNVELDRIFTVVNILFNSDININNYLKKLKKRELRCVLGQGSGVRGQGSGYSSGITRSRE